MDIIAPIIHPNGDQASTLINALRAQYVALNAALDLMCHARPNARNYYLKSGSYVAADDQQQQRIDTIKLVQTSLITELYAIQEQLA